MNRPALLLLVLLALGAAAQAQAQKVNEAGAQRRHKKGGDDDDDGGKPGREGKHGKHGGGKHSVVKLPAFGGYDCAGKITRIMCKVDDHGVLQDIVYYNDVSGYSQGCSAKHGYAEPNYYDNGWSGKLTLAAHESIIRIDACRGSKYGYTSVTFVTDADQTLQCGSEDSDYVPSDYGSYAEAYTALAYSPQAGQLAAAGTDNGKGQQDAQQDAQETGVARRLLQAEPVKKKKKGKDKDGDDTPGWGWQTKCQTYIAPKQPRWYARDSWYKSMDDVGFYGSSNKGYNTYFRYAGKKYYKDYSKYEHERKQHHAGKRARGEREQDADLEPEYYYHEVLPLSGFKLYCDHKEHVYALYGLCWNKNYKPELVCLRAKFVITLNEVDDFGKPLGCPKQPSEVAAYKDSLAQLSQHLALASAGIIQEIKWDTFSPQMCEQANFYYGGFDNTTINQPGCFVPGPGFCNEDVQNYLDTVAPDGDLSEVEFSENNIQYPVLTGTQFAGVSYIIGAARRRLLAAPAATPAPTPALPQTPAARRALAQLPAVAQPMQAAPAPAAAAKHVKQAAAAPAAAAKHVKQAAAAKQQLKAAVKQPAQGKQPAQAKRVTQSKQPPQPRQLKQQLKQQLQPHPKTQQQQQPQQLPKQQPKQQQAKTLPRKPQQQPVQSTAGRGWPQQQPKPQVQLQPASSGPAYSRVLHWSHLFG